MVGIIHLTVADVEPTVTPSSGAGAYGREGPACMDEDDRNQHKNDNRAVQAQPLSIHVFTKHQIQSQV